MLFTLKKEPISELSSSVGAVLAWLAHSPGLHPQCYSTAQKQAGRGTPVFPALTLEAEAGIQA